MSLPEIDESLIEEETEGNENAEEETVDYPIFLDIF